jgi:hypothetical protein
MKLAFMRLAAVAFTALVIAAMVFTVLVITEPLAAESVSGLTWTPPSSWKAEGARPMRAASYTIAAAPGDSEGGECVVYYFGPGQGGGVDANIERWVQQFQAPDGGPAAKLAKRASKTVNGIAVTTLDLTGTYLFKPFPMAPKATPKPGYRMLAAIAQGSDAPVFFKLTAPKKTADAAEADFWKMIEALKKQ